ncbi:HAD-IC family P-type ATPase [Gardnerella vaginalis]|uniref:HAD-IC family P-type ATPase n=1 Tax=Gardnerella leopoldii TaxID=2792978 RepID=UPI001571CCC0|nr:HAD-IC family P-type ATPase [Gardnerella vaginalis]NSX44650.1 HAD-IC family P-type ATPase [Gardnerella vaginalis]NSX52574.1 HAD-IC family P-type ATPase [Gardnerella vaginalis]
MTSNKQNAIASTENANNKAIAALPKVEVDGLSDEEVAEAVSRGDVNITSKQTSRSLMDIVRANVFTLFNAIIFTAMVVVLATGSWKDAVFGVVILVNTGIGIVTELKAKRTLDRLSILIAARAMVRRGGENIEIAHKDIVLGDVLWLRAGEQVPADVEVLESWGLEMDESMLTGESATVRKAQGDDVYSGSTAVSGMALTRVTAVGEHSYAAKLAAQAKVYTKTISDLSRGINTILKYMTMVVVPLCVLLVWSQMHKVGGFVEAWQTGAWRGAVVSAVAGVVGMIPEGLVLLTSLNFAVAAMRLARKQTLVQELESVETLARVDCLNLDKTGTITDGGIAFVGVENLDNSSVEISLQTSLQTNQALFDLSNEENPNATGVAIMQGLDAQGVAASAHVSNRLPFSSARKWSAVQYVQSSGERATWYMGAPEVLLSAINYANSNELLAKVNSYAEQGERVLLLAKVSSESSTVSSVDSSSLSSVTETDKTFGDSPTICANAQPVALVRCSERIREDARKTLSWFREQGVRCRVISGDNPRTVAAVAAKVGLTGDRKPVTMDARKLPEDINELAKVLENVDVLGRVLPHQKKAIVQALHTQGHVVAMTGDGVNDTLALKEADLGVAMGNAAPAAKAVAQVVLVDSRFSHLPDVVARGRQVMANMERVAGLFLVKTVYSALISAGVVLLALHFPYLPRHITYIGSLTIGIPAFLLALAPNTRRYIPGFLKRVVRFAVPSGFAIAASVLATAVIAPRVLGLNLDDVVANNLIASRFIVSNVQALATTRSICSVIVFVLGILVLASVAKPLCSWRGIMVALFAAAGVAGAFIPFTAKFFEIHVPTAGSAFTVMLIAVVLAVILWFACVSLANLLSKQSKK